MKWFVGVVSLYDMLRYAAEDFYSLSEEFTKLAMLPPLITAKGAGAKYQKHIDVLYEHCSKLELPMSLKQLETICELSRTRISTQQFREQVNQLQTRVKQELESKVCFCLPSDKKQYWHPFWLVGSVIDSNFPSAWKEFQSAGRCYAYGEATACAFHLQRALEVGLKSLALELGQRLDRNSWDAHLKDIERELTQRYTSAGARSPKEKLYSEIAAEFGHMKIAWRNPTMHIEAKYDDKEAMYLLTAVEKFMSHLAEAGLKEQP